MSRHKEDVRHLFPLCGYADRCGIEVNTGTYNTGLLSYGVVPDFEIDRYFVIIPTIAFCDKIGMDEELKVLWVLKYGDKLPTDVKQL